MRERDAYLRRAAERRRQNDDDGEKNGEGAAPEIEPGEAADEILNGFVLTEERFSDLAAREEFVLSVTEKGFGVRSSAYDYRITGRGGQGINNMDMSLRGDAIVAVFPVGSNDQIMLVTDAGMVIRCPVGDIRIARRGSAGVVIFRIGDGERVVSVARLPDETDGTSDAVGSGSADDQSINASQQTDVGDQ